MLDNDTEERISIEDLMSYRQAEHEAELALVKAKHATTEAEKLALDKHNITLKIYLKYHLVPGVDVIDRGGKILRNGRENLQEAAKAENTPQANLEQVLTTSANLDSHSELEIEPEPDSESELGPAPAVD